MLTISEQIRIITRRRGLTLSDLATATGQTRQNLNNKLTRDNFSVHDLEKIAAAAGLHIDIAWTDESGERVL